MAIGILFFWQQARQSFLVQICCAMLSRSVAAASRAPALSRALARTAAPALQPRAALARTAAPALRSFASTTFLSEEEVTDRVLGCVKTFDKVHPEQVTVKAHFLNDLGLDSLDTVEVVMAFEDEFVIEIQDADAEKILTCEDAIKYIMTHPTAK